MTRLIKPAPDKLAPLVRYLHAETHSSGSSTRIPASPFPLIGIYVTGGTRLDIDGMGIGKPTPRTFVVGPLTRPSTLHIEPDTQFVIAILQAGALPNFFSDDARRFTNRVTDLHELWPTVLLSHLIKDLTPRCTDESAIALLSILLASMTSATSPPLHIPERLWETPIAKIAAEASLSKRHFQRLVATYFGFPPRELKRFSRYLAALGDIMEGSKELPIAQLAANRGYFDQAHMTRDFRQLTGFSPRTLHDGIATSHHDEDILYFMRYSKYHLSTMGLRQYSKPASTESPKEKVVRRKRPI